MGRSSRIVAALAIVMAVPAWAQGPRAGVHLGMSSHPLVGPGVVPNPVQLPVQPFHQSLDAGSRRGRGAGFGVGGLLDPGVGFTTFGGNVLPDEAPFGGSGDGALPPPTVIPGLGPRPCVAPQIIRIGRVPEHAPKTRVIYGTPVCAYP